MKKLDETITARPVWDMTTEQVWQKRFASLLDDDSLTDERTEGTAKTVSLGRRIARIASVAAVLLVLISATAFLYTKKVTAPLGQTSKASLPDGSSAELSSASTITYRPLLWFLSPTVTMEGEAYFSGSHAKNFTVKTDKGSITVLGTSFSASTCHHKLLVACVEGKVRVADGASAVVLTANMQTVLMDKRAKTTRITDMDDVTGWTRGVFSFNNKPLREVLDDVERYYGVSVLAPAGIDTLRYTGRFTREKSPKDVLEIIAQTYGIALKIVR